MVDEEARGAEAAGGRLGLANAARDRPGGVRGPGIRWTKEMTATFLDQLAGHCHVGEAADAIGVPVSTVYKLRRRNKAFAAAWGEALALGYQMLETRLVGHVLAGGERTTAIAGDGARVRAIDVDLALRVLSTHRSAMAGKPFTGGRKPRIATREESNALLLKKLRTVERRLDLPALPPPGVVLHAAEFEP